MMLPLTESRRQVQIERYAAADLERSTRYWNFRFFYVGALAGGGLTVYLTARAIHALFLGAILRGLALLAVGILLYDMTRVYWNLAEIHVDKRQYYRLAAEESILGPDSGPYDVKKRQIEAFFKGTVYFRAILEPLVISILRKRFR